MKNNMAVTLRTYNDIDHIVPIIWKVLNEKHKVFLFCIGDYDFINDYRIKFILNDENLNFVHIQNSLFNKLKYNIVYWIIFIVKNNISTYMVEWSIMRFRGIRTHLFLAMKLLGKSNIAVPHGYNVFTNSDVNNHVKELLAKDKEIYKNRNNFTKYIFAQKFQEKQANYLGVSANITESLGSGRFSYEWHKVLSSIEKKTKKDTDKFTICFMTPHWSYNVDKESTINLISKIAQNNNIILYIKPHTRGSGELNLDSCTNIKYIENETSFTIINKSDLVIAFGTSIIFEAMLQGKYILNPAYLDTNKTIFDTMESIYQCDNESSVLSTIGSIFQNKPLVDLNMYKNIIFKYIYNGQNSEPLELYYNLLKKEGLDD